VWIGFANQEVRLDQDGDGVPLALDCNDANPDVSRLSSTEPTAPSPDDPVPPDTDAPGATAETGSPDTDTDEVAGAGLSCGATIVEALSVSCSEDDARPVCADDEGHTRPSSLGVLPCRHPGFTDRLVEVGSIQNVHRLEVDTPTDVLVVVDIDPDPGSGVTPAGELHPYAALVANRGRTCSQEACALGTPLLDSGALPDQPFTVSFTAQPGEPWYLIVSGPSGWYTLDVRCGEAE
jgi:hypothetical protein